MKPGTVVLAGEWRGLAVPGGEATGRLVREVTRAWMRKSVVGFVFLPLCSKQGAICKRGVLWKGERPVGVRGGVRVVDDVGYSLLCAHGLIVLFRRVVVAVKEPAQLADVTASETQIY